ncbi:MAG: ABC transporter permease [Gemmatimonadales bacterium]
MRKVWAVIRREVVERVRTKAFILSTLLFPVLMGVLVVLPAFLMGRSTGTRTVALVDATTNDLGSRIEATLQSERIGRGPEALPRYRVQRFPAAGRATLVRDSLVPYTGLSRKRAGGWDGILVVSDSTVPSGRADYYGANVASFRDMEELERTMRPVVIAERLEGIGVDLETVMKSVQGINLATTKVSNGRLTSESGASTFVLAYAMGFILYFALLLFGTQVMTSIIEEKTSRIVEVLASSLTPFQMMLGKVVGVGLVALIQLGIWAGIAAYLGSHQAQILGLFGATPGPGGPMFTLPAMPLDLMVVFFLFFALGFLLYAAAYAAVGAMCSTVQDAQQLQMPVMLFVLAGFFSTFALMRDPNGTAAQVLSFIPMLAPFAVPLRYSISPIAPLELVASIAVTVLGMLLIVWVASRIYRVGILMYGKKATLRDMVRWVRTA